MTSSHPRTSLRRSSPSTTTAPATSGSQTITQSAAPTLRLRGQHTPQPTSSSSSRRHIQWDESVVDNEGMGKKSSKVCCIYHKPHEPGDSESETSSSSGSDSEPDLSRAQKAGGGRGRGKRKGGKGEEGDGAGGKGKGKERKASPNAYERQPKARVRKEG